MSKNLSNSLYISTFIYFCIVDRLVAIYRGKSEHHSTTQWLTAINREIRNSATESMYR